jgi:23S rRNA pseudouridine2457 synthase
MSSFQYFVIYKPFGMLSQFTKEGEHATLADLFEFPKDVYPVGRLDSDSEGLLILSNDKKLNHALLDPSNGHKRTYYAQVEGTMTADACVTLEKGVDISVDGKTYTTKPCTVKIMDAPKNIPDRIPPIRVRKTVPDSWISLTLEEGKNRQVRKMTAAAGFPTLRLIRYAIEKLDIKNMLPSDVREISRMEAYDQLKLFSSNFSNFRKGSS